MKNAATNWKTTAAGLLALAAALAAIWAPPELARKIQVTAGVFAASGLVAAKDAGR
jgi:hypothetical protein